MDEIQDTAKAYYENLSKLQRIAAYDYFKSWDTDGDNKIDLKEYCDKLNQKGIKGIAHNDFFKKLDNNGDGTLDFEEFLTLYYIIESGRFEFCEGCQVFLEGVYFTCVECYNSSTADSFDICCSCYRTNNFQHHDGATFVDNYMLLRSKKPQQASPSQSHVSTRTRMKKWAKKCWTAMTRLGEFSIFHFGVESVAVLMQEETHPFVDNY